MEIVEFGNRFGFGVPPSGGLVPFPPEAAGRRNSEQKGVPDLTARNPH